MVPFKPFVPDVVNPANVLAAIVEIVNPTRAVAFVSNSPITPIVLFHVPLSTTAIGIANVPAPGFDGAAGTVRLNVAELLVPLIEANAIVHSLPTILYMASVVGSVLNPV